MRGHQALGLIVASTGLAGQSASPYPGALLSSTASSHQGQGQGQDHHPGALQSSAGPPQPAQGQGTLHSSPDPGCTAPRLLASQGGLQSCQCLGQLV